MDVLLWGVLPYVVLVLLVGGTVWRYRYDKFGWTTRSSQLYERRLLRIGSPLFHVGILLVALGHVGGLLIPESWTDAAGVSETAYHAVAVGLGTLAGFCTLAGAWFRSVFYFQPRIDLILTAPIGFQLHALSAWVLFAFWPFSRLVHVFSAPLGYLTRPYIVYRSRDAQTRAPRRGWERVG